MNKKKMINLKIKKVQVLVREKEWKMYQKKLNLKNSYSDCKMKSIMKILKIKEKIRMRDLIWSKTIFKVKQKNKMMRKMKKKMIRIKKKIWKMKCLK